MVNVRVLLFFAYGWQAVVMKRWASGSSLELREVRDLGQEAGFAEALEAVRRLLPGCRWAAMEAEDVAVFRYEGKCDGSDYS